MTATMERPVPARGDRYAFTIFTALISAGVLIGFGVDSFTHVRSHGLDYPLLVHVHALVFTSWLILFTVQVALVQTRRTGLHKTLGVAGAALALVMMVLGPATAWGVASTNFDGQGDTPEFLIVEFTTTLAFAVFTGTGLLTRRCAPVHKRLMLLGLMYLSTPGFARFLNRCMISATGLAHVTGHGFWGLWSSIYLGSDLMILSLGIYDFVTRHRLYPAYVAGTSFAVLLQVTALMILQNPAWSGLSHKLIGR